MSQLKLALIPPTALLDYTGETNYQLALPHLQDKQYIKKYKELSERGDYVILDNGVAEGWDVTPSALTDFGRKIGADELVLSDVIGSSLATVEVAKHAIQSYDEATIAGEFTYMAVVQGSNLNEFKWCVQQYATMHYIRTLGIPRHMLKTCQEPHARVEFVEWALRHFPHRFRYHFLGMDGDFPYEAWHIFNEFHLSPSVRGLDTSLPFNYAFAGESISHPREKRHRPSDYFNLPGDMFSDYVLKYNISQLKKWLHVQ